MSIADIIPAPAVRSIVDLALDEVWRGRRALINAFGAPDRMRGANAPTPGLAYALTRVRRLMRLVRYALLIVATWLELPDRKRHRDRRLPAGNRADPCGASASPTARTGWKPAVPVGPATPRFSFGRPYRVWFDDTPRAAQPDQFRHARRNGLRTLARHIEALTAVMLEPMPHVRRLARRLRRGDIFLLPRRPKRAPRCDRRDHCERLDDTRDHLHFELRQRRWVGPADTS